MNSIINNDYYVRNKIVDLIHNNSLLIYYTFYFDWHIFYVRVYNAVYMGRYIRNQVIDEMCETYG